MNPDEVKALIQSSIESALPGMLKGAFSEFQKHFDSQITPITERLNQFEVAGESDDGSITEEAGTDNPLAKRLAILEKQLSESQKREQQRLEEAQQLQFDNTLGESLASKGNIIQQGLVKELLANRLRNGAVQKDGEWYTKDGSKLTEAVDGFFKTEQGLHFLPSDHQNGMSTPSTKQPPSNGKVDFKDLSVDEMLANTTW